MRIAQVPMPVAAPAVAQPTAVTETVSPTRLFGIARARIQSALGTLSAAGPEALPSAILTILAINQAQAGVQTLRSVLMPSTPFDLRTRAATAADRSHLAIDALRAYHAHVVPFGEGPIDVDAVHPGSRVLLESARSMLRSVVDELR